MSKYRDQLEAWLKTISVKTENVLDLGGASNPVRARVKSWQVNTCMFLDNGAEEAKVQYMPFDINKSLGQLEGYNFQENKIPKDFIFDAVFCLEVFEYVWNPVQAVKNIYDFMNNDSVAYISFPAIYPVHNPVDIDSLRYTKNGIIKLLTNAGFKPENIQITAREATLGRLHLADFYASEGMHPVRHSTLPYDIGYLVKARKLGI